MRSLCEVGPKLNKDSLTMKARDEKRVHLRLEVEQEAYLNSSSANEDGDEEVVAQQALKTVLLVLKTARVDLVEQLHEDERVEDDGKVPASHLLGVEDGGTCVEQYKAHYQLQENFRAYWWWCFVLCFFKIFLRIVLKKEGIYLVSCMNNNESPHLSCD